MILGVDHLALSCSSLDTAVRHLESLALKTVFLARGVRNDPAKRPFLGHYESLHDIAYCKPEQGIALELTRHATPLLKGQSAFQVLVVGNTPGVEPMDTTPVDVGGEVFQSASLAAQPVRVWSAELQAELWQDAAQSSLPLSVKAVLLPVPELSRAEHFWVAGLGARTVTHGRTAHGCAWKHVAIRRPIPSWSLDVVLAECSSRGGLSMLDASGFPCLALLTNRLEADLERAMAHGGRARCDDFHLEVAGQPRRIVLFRGPGGEIVELVEVLRAKA